MPNIIPLTSRIDLQTGGGKAMNLSILIEEGFNVPDGFLITTTSYILYVKHNRLQNVIQEAFETGDDLVSITKASEQIRAAFRSGVIPDDLRCEILESYQTLSGKVAVRSSATAEDLPGMSFAGQQDTFLNVGEEELLSSVVECWSSLWTPRAIGYRNRNQIDHKKVALAVVVQSMVDSETSGVMFTVNPLTGNRTETVIDATFGLGEALVSGQVEPDNYVVDTVTGTVKDFKLGSKGGDASRALSDDQLQELTRIGSGIHTLYGSPQDIEWAYSKGRLFILQSRPVTGLFSLLEGVPETPFTIYASFNHIQGVLTPFTPMGSDMLRYLIITHGKQVGSKLEMEQTSFLVPAGGRLYTNMTGLVQNIKFHDMAENILQSIEPEMGGIFKEIKNDPRVHRTNRRPNLSTITRIIRVMGSLAVKAINAVRTPETSRERLNTKLENQLLYWNRAMQATVDPYDHLELIGKVFHETPPIIFNNILPCVVAGIGSFMYVKRTADSLDMGFDGLNIARGLPHNVTSEMDLDLWARVKRIRNEPDSTEALGRPLHKLIELHSRGKLPSILSYELISFLELYGMRGTAEIDVGAPRWIDEPAHIIQTMQSYLSISDPEKEPDVVFSKGFASGEESRKRIIKEVKQKKGWLHGRLIETLCNSQKHLASLRETPKFFIVRTFGIIRTSLQAIGEHLMSTGVLLDSSDVFFLRFNELHSAIGSTEPLHELVADRRSVNDHDSKLKRVPRMITSEGDAYYSPRQTGDTGISGSPVSPGTVEGVVKVLLTPTSDKLNPGEILVCPATDPSWTPLFLAAGGLVMEVGGLMTHGSVVAREYGIPAVVGVRDATSRLETGQRIRVDGESGVITLLTEEGP